MVRRALASKLATTTRTIPENTGKGMPVGAAVVASDPNDDRPTYDLEDEDNRLRYRLGRHPMAIRYGRQATSPLILRAAMARSLSRLTLSYRSQLDTCNYGAWTNDNNADREPTSST